MLEILKDRSVLRISGIDSLKFLQGLVTNDIENKIFSYNYLLNNQGRYLFDFFVFKENNDNFFIDLHMPLTQDLMKLTSMYKLRSNIKIEDISSGYKIIYSDEKIEGAEFSFTDPRFDKLGYRSLIKIDKMNMLGGNVENLYLADKYKYAIIDGYIDLSEGKSIPVEYGAEELNALSYTKGCYIGQEVISRAKYQGVVRKKIYLLEFSQMPRYIEKKSEIYDEEENKIGLVCSIKDNLVIAIVREEKYLGLNKKQVIVNGQTADIFIPPWR